MGVIDYLFYLVFVYTLMVIFHELGHIIVVRLYGLRYKIGFCEVRYNTKDPIIIKRVLLGGIGFGLVPALLLVGLNFWVNFSIVLAYLIQCKYDMNRLRQLSHT